MLRRLDRPPVRLAPPGARCYDYGLPCPAAPLFSRVWRRRAGCPVGRFPSGQRGQTVNLLRNASEVRILPSPPVPARIDRCVDGSSKSEHAPDSSPSARGSRSKRPHRFEKGLGNPPRSGPVSEKQNGSRHLRVATTTRAGIAQLVEHQPSKLRVAGSSPVSRSRYDAVTGSGRSLGPRRGRPRGADAQEGSPSPRSSAGRALAW